jgi:hypothetical protein
MLVDNPNGLLEIHYKVREQLALEGPAGAGRTGTVVQIGIT